MNTRPGAAYSPQLESIKKSENVNEIALPSVDHQRLGILDEHDRVSLRFSAPRPITPHPAPAPNPCSSPPVGPGAGTLGLALRPS